MARKGYNKNQPRDSRGRWSGGGGGGNSGGGAKVGRSGPRGGKVGTRTEQRRNAEAQAARSAQFRGKAAPNAAKTAYKSSTSRLRFVRAARAEGASSAQQVKNAQSAVTRLAASRVGAKPKSKTAAPVAAKSKATSSAQAARNKQFSSKAAPNAVKTAYKSSTSRLRFVRAARAQGASSAQQVKNAQSAVTRLIANSGSRKPTRRRRS